MYQLQYSICGKKNQENKHPTLQIYIQFNIDLSLF